MMVQCNVMVQCNGTMQYNGEMTQCLTCFYLKVNREIQQRSPLSGSRRPSLSREVFKNIFLISKTGKMLLRIPVREPTRKINPHRIPKRHSFYRKKYFWCSPLVWSARPWGPSPCWPRSSRGDSQTWLLSDIPPLPGTTCTFTAPHTGKHRHEPSVPSVHYCALGHVDTGGNLGISDRKWVLLDFGKISSKQKNIKIKHFLCYLSVQFN